MNCWLVLVKGVFCAFAFSAMAGDALSSEQAERDLLDGEFRERLQWWSLQPRRAGALPEVKQADWPGGELDRFVLAELESKGLEPAPQAHRRGLARRLSFALIGLPPDSDLVERFAADPSPNAYEGLVDRLLASPHFGERWARHWMDVVHYSDTHGYEWDVPIKNAWRYRDYLIRAFNADLSYRQLVLEQLAGDLIPPRIDLVLGIQESLIGPLMLRLGERRHGDNSAAEGVTQEALANMIDTIGKAFLGTTLACAQCHDHKLDAVDQRDYYSLAGMLMSTRFSARPIDAIDPNQACIQQLGIRKQVLRRVLADRWRKATDPENQAGAIARLQAIPMERKSESAFPSSLLGYWKRSQAAPVTAQEFLEERQRRIEANRKNLRLMADLTRESDPSGWRWEGWGMEHGLVQDGELVVAEEGDLALLHLLPAGRFSHAWSQRMAGSLQSPEMDSTQPKTFSVELMAGKFASLSFIVDRALNPERLQFPKKPQLEFLALTAGNFDSLEGTVDRSARRVYLELATKSLNNYFPPRVGYGGVSETEIQDPRSWFGVSRIYEHPPGQPPQDELARFLPLFQSMDQQQDWARRLVGLLHDSVQRWSEGVCHEEDVRLLNEGLQLELLPNRVDKDPELAGCVSDYRALEKTLQADRTVGSVADWQEGADERLGERGSYTDLGETVQRGTVRFLGAGTLPIDRSSQRREWAERLADPGNPLTARVYVNRVWHYLFGEGLVRTPDDFGHLGETPTHPILLDHLAERFVQEGWSTKKLIRAMVTSATWRQSSMSGLRARQVDPENRLWHHMPLRRLEAEAIRDSLLTVSGRMEPLLFGLPIEPWRAAEDAQKRLFRGPLDGEGRRSLYLEMTLMEPPRFLALFNQPIPKQTVGRRDRTNVPDQALVLLNDPFIQTMSEQWSRRCMQDGAVSIADRARSMLQQALSRPPDEDETRRLVAFIQESARLHGHPQADLACQAVWRDAAHAIFNLKEFVYVP
jgi:hypothetical protein